jgi:dTDP-4-amino-4,6-dideoxygalactose transaminase
MKVPFLDLSIQYGQIKKEVNTALNEVIERGDFILGKDVINFEKEFARYCQSKFAVGVNSGTDALFLGLLSCGIGPGDEVIVPVFTYIATSLAVTFSQAKPVFVDISKANFNIDVFKIEQAINKKTKAIIPVHLYGQAAYMEPIAALAKKYKLKIIEDAAQAHGAKYKTRTGKWLMAGSMGDVGCFSFYPTKNLGAFGDGGMVVTDNEDNYKRLLMLRDYGRKSRYEHVTLGYNSRLDTMQAAVLRIKLKYIDNYNKMRRSNALAYARHLKGIKGVILPKEEDYARHIYHAYVIRVDNRALVMDAFKKEGIGALIHYPIPLHLQKVYAGLGYKKGDFPVAEEFAQQVISLPMHPYLKESQIRFIAATLRRALA